MTTSLITRTYNDLTFTFRDDGYFNMTKAAKHFGKTLENFMRSTSTKEYVAALSVNFTGKEFVVIKYGFFNMTAAAKHFGKQLQHFWNAPDTKVYLDAVRSPRNSRIQFWFGLP